MFVDSELGDRDGAAYSFVLYTIFTHLRPTSRPTQLPAAAERISSRRNTKSYGNS